ncbi:MAG: hypothetical protein ACREF9_15435 [Opitutaceae bacterium]
MRGTEAGAAARPVQALLMTLPRRTSAQFALAHEISERPPVHGALASGLRAAKELRAVLKKLEKSKR